MLQKENKQREVILPTELKGLDASKIGELLAGTRTRNQYGPLLMEFMESDEAAINPA